MNPIKCRQCGRDNPPGARYCKYCGSLITLPPGNSVERQNPIREEIRQLRELVNQINFRLNVLENKQSISGEIIPLPEEIPPEAIAYLPKTEAPAETSPGPAAVTGEPAHPKEIPSEATAYPPETELPAEKITEPVAITAEPEQPTTLPPGIKEQITKQAKPIPVERKPKEKKNREWEQILGGNWLARIGILALIIGMGFFLKFAIDKNWIGPSARVIMGVIVGLVLLGLGYYWRKRYPIMTQVLSGGGIAILYLSIFACFAMFHLVPIYLAVLLLLIISGISTVLAIRYESMALAIIGIFGAFFAPFILGAFDDRSQEDGKSQAVLLLVYIIVVDIGVLVLSNFRNWRWFTLLALGCSLITYGFWYGEFHRQTSIATAEIGITSIYLIFAGVTSLFHIIRRRIPLVFDYILVLLSAGAYISISLFLMWDEFRGWMGGFILLLAVFYGVIAYFSYNRNPENTGLSKLSLAIALVLLTAAIPIQFRNHATTTIAFAIEGLAFIWLSFHKNLFALRIFSYIVFSMMAIKLICFDTWLEKGAFIPVFNERFLAFIVSIAFTWLAAFICWRNREKIEGIPYIIFVFAADFFTLWITGAEVLHFSRHMYTASTVFNLLILLVLAAATMMNLVIWRRKPTTIDIILTGLNAVAFAITNIFIWRDLRAWMGTAYFLPAIFYGILTYFIMKKEGNKSRLGSFSLIIALLFLTAAIPIQFSNDAVRTIAWVLEGAVLMWLSFRKNINILRICSYVIFSLAAFWLLTFDTWLGRGNDKVIFNDRFLAFIISITLLWATAFLLWKNRKEAEGIAYPVFIFAADFITLWIIGAEAHNYTRRSITTESSLSLLILLVLSATALMNYLFWRRKPINIDIVLSIFNAAALIIISIFVWGDLRAWMGTAYLLPAIFYGILTWFLIKKRDEGGQLSSFTLAIALVFLAVAIPVQFRDSAPTTIGWAILMAALVWLSFKLKLPLMRYFSYIVFAAMTLRMLIYDRTVEISTFKPVLNERFLACITGIALIYLTTYLLWRQRNTLKEWKIVFTCMLIVSSFLTLFLISYEVWDTYRAAIRSNPSGKDGLSDAQNLSLTAVWAVYAVAGLITGIRKHWRYVRIGALALLAVPIIKVFVYDVFMLDREYRIGAFIGLGVLLLVSAYLYQRYSKIIKGVFTNK